MQLYVHSLQNAQGRVLESCYHMLVHTKSSYWKNMHWNSGCKTCSNHFPCMAVGKGRQYQTMQDMVQQNSSPFQVEKLIYSNKKSV